MAPLEEAPVRKGPSGRFYSPLVRSIAQKEGITMSELEKVSGTGSEGRVTKKDILAYVDQRKGKSSSSQASIPSPSPAPVPAPNPAMGLNTVAAKGVDGAYDIVEMDRMRKMIADHMVRSVHTSPHVTSFVEADDQPCDVAQCQQKDVSGKVWRKADLHSFDCRGHSEGDSRLSRGQCKRSRRQHSYPQSHPFRHGGGIAVRQFDCAGHQACSISTTSKGWRVRSMICVSRPNRKIVA